MYEMGHQACGQDYIVYCQEDQQSYEMQKRRTFFLDILNQIRSILQKGQKKMKVSDDDIVERIGSIEETAHFITSLAKDMNIALMKT